MTDHAAPPGLPDIVDEAVDTPSWVPWLGFAFLVAAALYAFAGGREGSTPTGATPAPASTRAPAAQAAHE